MPKRNIFLICIIINFCGCFPIPGHYLKPTTSEGLNTHWGLFEVNQQFNVINQTIVGADENSIFFIREKVKILVHAHQCTPKLLTVYLGMQIPENNTVEIPDSIIKVAAGQSTDYKTGELKPKGNLFHLDTMSGVTKKHKYLFGEEDIYKIYYVSAQIPLPQSDTYRVLLPKLVINGISTEFPEISLKKTFHMDAHGDKQCWW